MVEFAFGRGATIEPPSVPFGSVLYSGDHIGRPSERIVLIPAACVL
jgi:hypothetical protein